MQISKLESDLQRSETRANATRNELERNRAEVVAGSGADNLVKEELSKLRRENDRLHHSIHDYAKKISVLESDKTELETRVYIPHFLMAKDKTGECMCTVYSVGMYCTFKYIDGLDEKKKQRKRRVQTMEEIQTE